MKLHIAIEIYAVIFLKTLRLFLTILLDYTHIFILRTYAYMDH